MRHYDACATSSGSSSFFKVSESMTTQIISIANCNIMYNNYLLIFVIRTIMVLIVTHGGSVGF